MKTSFRTNTLDICQFNDFRVWTVNWVWFLNVFGGWILQRFLYMEGFVGFCYILWTFSKLILEQSCCKAFWKWFYGSIKPMHYQKAVDNSLKVWKKTLWLSFYVSVKNAEFCFFLFNGSLRYYHRLFEMQNFCKCA